MYEPCVRCGKEVYYPTKGSLRRAQPNGVTCRSCLNTIRWEKKQEELDSSLPRYVCGNCGLELRAGKLHHLVGLSEESLLLSSKPLYRTSHTVHTMLHPPPAHAASPVKSVLSSSSVTPVKSMLVTRLTSSSYLSLVMSSKGICGYVPPSYGSTLMPL